MATSKISSFHLSSMVVALDQFLEDTAQKFIEHVCTDMDAGSAQAFRNQAAVLIERGELRELVESFAGCLSRIAANSSLENLEARFMILFSFIRTFPAEQLSVVVPKLNELVVQLPTKAGAEEACHTMKLDILRTLYTVINPKDESRFVTLVTMIQYCLSNNKFTVLEGTVASDVEQLCSMWYATNPEAAVAQKRRLLMMLSDLAQAKCSLADLSKTDRKFVELKHHRFLTKLLETYEESPELLAEANPYAVRAVVLSIKYPLPGDMAEANTLESIGAENQSIVAAEAVLAHSTFAQRSDWAGLTATASSIANYAAVKFLSSKPEHATLYNLLQVFASKGLSEFDSFTAENKGFLQSQGLDEELCRRNIRLLTLASLASKAETIDYDTIAKALQVNTGDVERWVIDGILCKVIDAKMDQLGKSIIINRGSQRLLTEEQWVEVQAKLAQWKSGLRSLLNTVKSVQSEQIAMAAAQQQQSAQPQTKQSS